MAWFHSVSDPGQLPVVGIHSRPRTNTDVEAAANSNSTAEYADHETPIFMVDLGCSQNQQRYGEEEVNHIETPRLWVQVGALPPNAELILSHASDEFLISHLTIANVQLVSTMIQDGAILNNAGFFYIQAAMSPERLVVHLEQFERLFSFITDQYAESSVAYSELAPEENVPELPSLPPPVPPQIRSRNKLFFLVTMYLTAMVLIAIGLCLTNPNATTDLTVVSVFVVLLCVFFVVMYTGKYPYFMRLVGERRT